jgi:hypothetical protein
MRPVLTQTLRSRWLVTGVHVGMWLLLYLAVTSFGGKSPDYRDATSVSTPVQSPAPVARLSNLFSPGVWPASLAETNLLNPFFTRHFIPARAPAPPPPTTRKIDLTYQGYYQPVDGYRHVIVKAADAFLVVPVGAKVTANLYAAEATMQALTLTNPAAQTNLLLLNMKKEIEVPIP